MATKRNAPPFQGHDDTGLDAPYKAERERAKRELDRTMAGPRGSIVPVGADDSDVKNPDSEFSQPGSAAPLKRGVDTARDNRLQKRMP
jgi:hypothetical protein